VEHSLAEMALVGLAGLGAGAVNAMAGGGSLISFPALVAVGVPTVAANVTNTVALCPGYLGGAVAQRRDLTAAFGSHRRMLIASGLGGLLGAVLLVSTSEAVFDVVVPFLVLFACLALGVQDPVKRWLARREPAGGETAGTSEASGTAAHARPSTVGFVLVASIYGGYFGAGLGIVLLAVLGLVLDEPLRSVNALKSLLALVINLVAASFLVFSGDVQWSLAAVMAVTSLGGGVAGGRLVRHVDPRLLRTLIVLFGLAVAVSLFLRL
jgi:uncharacterized membrane protein YfcA